MKISESYNLSNFTESQFTTAISGFVAIDVSWGIVGCIGNTILAWTIFRTPALRSKNSLLLAWLGVYDVFASISNVVSALNHSRWLFFDHPPLPIKACFLILMTLKFIPMFCGTILILACAMDRLLMMKFPVPYMSFNTKLYVLLWNAAAWLFSLVSVFAQWSNLTPDYATLHFCDYNFLFDIGIDQFLTAVHVPVTFTIIAINFCSVCFVSEVLIAESDANLDRKRRFQESLLLVVYVYISTWTVAVCLASVENFIYPIMAGQPIYALHLLLIFCINFLAHTNASVNFFIYYVRNSDYRREFRCLLRLNAEADSETKLFSRREMTTQRA